MEPLLKDTISKSPPNLNITSWHIKTIEGCLSYLSPYLLSRVTVHFSWEEFWSKKCELFETVRLTEGDGRRRRGVLKLTRRKMCSIGVGEGAGIHCFCSWHIMQLVCSKSYSIHAVEACLIEPFGSAHTNQHQRLQFLPLWSGISH